LYREDMVATGGSRAVSAENLEVTTAFSSTTDRNITI